MSWQVCDDPEELQRKVRELASAVRNAKYLVVYTGAGISTVGTRGGDDCALDRLPGLGKHGLLELGQAGGAPFWVSDSGAEHSILLSNGTDLQKLTAKASPERLYFFRETRNDSIWTFVKWIDVFKYLKFALYPVRNRKGRVVKTGLDGLVLVRRLCGQS